MKQVSPFDGAPQTVVFTDKQGRRAFIVKPHYLTPWRFKVTRFLTIVTTWAVMAGAGSIVTALDNTSGWGYAAALFGPWLLWPVWFAGVRYVLSQTKKIVLTEETVEISGLFGSKQYNRLHDHKFSLVQHDAARSEQRKHELEVRREASKGRLAAKLPVYGNSFHLSFDYLGQRNDLMTIYGQEEAVRILTRLIACDEVLNAQAGLGEGYSTDPEDDWKAGPGAL